MGREIADHPTVVQIPDTGHWMAEQNPTGLAEALTRFDARTRDGGRRAR